MTKRLLILGGTGEAATLAGRIIDRFGDALEVTNSLAGRVKNPRPLPGRVRVGGFGGSAGLAQFITAEKIDLLIDASHPFATTISANAHAACQKTDTPRLILLRPPWPEINCLEVDDLAAAAKILPTLGRRAFLSFGQGGLAAFSSLPDVAFVVRVIDPPATPLPLPDATVITGRPPFSLAGEKALFEQHAIDVVISKNSGGASLPAKISAALEMDIPLVLIARPPSEPGEHATGIEGTLGWISSRL